jgi:hypothetical protein
MKLRILTTLIISISLLSFSGKDLNDEILINEILTLIVKGDTTILNKDCKIVDGFNSALQSPAKSYLDPVFFASLSPYFRTEDIDFYTNQVIKNKNTQLIKNESFKAFGFIKKQKVVNFIAKVESDYVKEKEFDYWERFEKNIGKVQEFGLPLVSKDGKYALIRFFCISGSKKNKGFLRIYEKQDNDWILVKSLKEWDK